ncbi:acylglycerol lipase NDAI_0K02170 [Naumovozyma dairenensis CBS 421]|uniref:Serine aminopeptidase S33 domain-containing protein n=1 Tax=Naumovozyma dairenensis (strain ATCC 10597 / BCRC 20456 / CBS 421 / NBRC 0211 / NRRL Y-12639) TaxID=1071378 RepID=G0WHZ7_NAUDC|nr:hypothetical protein NDAI_0K02170 [Naumovozyma dairenensis CBS 421]CCD27408.1 hypothetical protein NDAI_0K02170 [Naumovozyma dairenensis CBS 421]
MTTIEYPYIPKTEVPEIQYEEFNGAKFGYMLWPVQNLENITTKSNNNNDDDDGDDDQTPNNPIKGRVILIHGFGEYTKLQYRLMDHLSYSGYESFTFDQRGAGVTSPGKLKGLTNEYHTFNDLDHFLEKNLQECQEGKIPLFLWGHSMGGGIILNYSCMGKYKDQINGYIGSGPLIILHPHTAPNKVTQILSPILAKWLPRTKIDTGLDLEGITTDKRYREWLANDKPMSVPLYGTFRQIYDFLERGKKLYNNRDDFIGKNFNKDTPILIMHGKDDTINDPKGSKAFIENCPSKDKQLNLYPGMRHSIFSLETDENFEKVFADFKKWLDDHVTK